MEPRTTALEKELMEDLANVFQSDETFRKGIDGRLSLGREEELIG